MKLRVWCESCKYQFLVIPPSEQTQKERWFFVCNKCYEDGRGFSDKQPHQSNIGGRVKDTAK